MVVFHKKIRERLVRQLQTGTQPHSLLLVGPRGVGKRTLARWYAQALLCETAARTTPCGICTACTAVIAGSHPDAEVLPHGHATLSIEAFRALKERLMRTPLRAQCSVIVITDSERLSLAAQQACLKTLEEPRSASYLILTASSPEALVLTMRSRLTRINLNPVPSKLMRGALHEADGELSAEERESLAGYARGIPARVLDNGQIRAGVRNQMTRMTNITSLKGAPLWRIAQVVRAIAGENKENDPPHAAWLLETGMRQAFHTRLSPRQRRLWMELSQAQARSVNNNLAHDAFAFVLAQ